MRRREAWNFQREWSSDDWWYMIFSSKGSALFVELLWDRWSIIGIAWHGISTIIEKGSICVPVVFLFCLSYYLKRVNYQIMYSPHQEQVVSCFHQVRWEHLSCSLILFWLSWTNFLLWNKISCCNFMQSCLMDKYMNDRMEKWLESINQWVDK